MIQELHKTSPVLSLSSQLNSDGAKCLNENTFNQTLETTADFIFGRENQYQIEIANDLESKKEAYRLIYDLYRDPEIGFADVDSSEMWYSKFYAHPDTATFIVRDTATGEVIASLTAVIDSDLGLPMETSYPEQIKELRTDHRKCAEMISLGVRADHKGNREILIQLIKFSYFYARGLKGVTDYLIMICPRHAVFYERKFMYEAIGVEKSCMKVKNKTVKLYRLNLEFAEEQVMVSRRKNKKLKSIFNYFKTAAECSDIVKALGRGLRCFSKSELIYLFEEQRAIFRSSSAEVLEVLKDAYGTTETRDHLEVIYLEKCFYEIGDEVVGGEVVHKNVTGHRVSSGQFFLQNNAS